MRSHTLNIKPMIINNELNPHLRSISPSQPNLNKDIDYINQRTAKQISPDLNRHLPPKNDAVLQRHPALPWAGRFRAYTSRLSAKTAPQSRKKRTQTKHARTSIDQPRQHRIHFPVNLRPIPQFNRNNEEQ